MINKILHTLPLKLANSIVAHIILKSKVKDVENYYQNVKLKYASSIKMDLCKHDIGHQYLAFTGVYENELTKLIMNIKNQDGGVMVDVGANYGYYSLLWCADAVQNQAICFEASPKNLNAITNNIYINDLSNQIKLEKIAVSNQLGKIYFDQGSEEQTGWGGISNTSDGVNTVEVETITLDKYFENKNHFHINILKIDTEGADYLVIKGAIGLIKNQKIKHIFWEENVYRAKKLGLIGGEAKVLFKENGYKVSQIGSNEYHAFIS